MSECLSSTEVLGECFKSCAICDEFFVIYTINDPRTICPRCKEILKEFILERSSEHYEPNSGE